jgi:hypothetical protein
MLLFYTVDNDFSSVAAYIPIDKSKGFTLLLVISVIPWASARPIASTPEPAGVVMIKRIGLSGKLVGKFCAKTAELIRVKPSKKSGASIELGRILHFFISICLCIPFLLPM